MRLETAGVGAARRLPCECYRNHSLEPVYTTSKPGNGPSPSEFGVFGRMADEYSTRSESLSPGIADMPVRCRMMYDAANAPRVDTAIPIAGALARM